MPVTQSPLHPRGERGFSMFIVVTAMLVTAMFVAAGFAAADGGLNLSVENKERKASYAAAEAGLGYYLKRLRENPDVWTQCDTASAPNGRRPARSTSSGTRRPGRPIRAAGARSRALPAEYTVELLHTSKYTKCETTANKQDSMIDMSTGTFKVRITGRATTDTTAKRSIIVTLPPRELPEVRVLHRPGEPRPAGRERLAAMRPQQTNCANRYRSARDRMTRLRRDPVRDRRRDQRAAAHQRREPAGLRHADLRPREEQGRFDRQDRRDRGRGVAPGHTPSTAGARDLAHDLVADRQVLAEHQALDAAARPTRHWRRWPRTAAASTPARRSSTSAAR